MYDTLLTLLNVLTDVALVLGGYFASVLIRRAIAWFSPEAASNRLDAMDPEWEMHYEARMFRHDAYEDWRTCWWWNLTHVLPYRIRREVFRLRYRLNMRLSGTRVKNSRWSDGGLNH